MAWIWPGSIVRSILSLATRAPYRLVMPRSSSRTDPSLPPRWQPARAAVPPWPERRRALGRALGRRLDRAADQALLDLRQLRLQGRGDLSGEVVVRREHDASVGQVADVVAALEGAGRGGQDGRLDRGLNALGHAGDEVLAVLLGFDAAVGVHPLHVDLVGARRRVRVL